MMGQRHLPNHVSSAQQISSELLDKYAIQPGLVAPVPAADCAEGLGFQGRAAPSPDRLADAALWAAVLGQLLLAPSYNGDGKTQRDVAQT
jgi:hypothetical protein